MEANQSVVSEPRQLHPLALLDREQSTMLAHGITVGHAGYVVGHCPGTLALVLVLKRIRKQARLPSEGFIKLADDAACLARHAVDPVMAIQVIHEKTLQFLLLAAALRAEFKQCATGAHIVDILDSCPS